MSSCPSVSTFWNLFSFDMEQAESDFTKDLLMLMLREYELFVDSFQFACKNFKDNAENDALAQTMGFKSNKEYNEIMFLREITHTVNMFNDMDIKLKRKAEEVDLFSEEIWYGDPLSKAGEGLVPDRASHLPFYHVPLGDPMQPGMAGTSIRTDAPGGHEGLHGADGGRDPNPVQ